MSDLSDGQLRDFVLRELEQSALAGAIRNVAIAYPDDDDGVVVRVVLVVDHPDELDRQAAFATLRDLETAIGQVDHRVPSFRFAEAA